MLTEDELIEAMGEHRRIYAQTLYRRYAAADHIQSYSSIAEAFGLTRQAIQIRCKKGLKMLRHHSRRRFVCAHVPVDGLLWQALFGERDPLCHKYPPREPDV